MGLSLGSLTIMGRYYNGDIEGKFWFGVQPSEDIFFFGGTEVPASFRAVHYKDGDMAKVEDGLIECYKVIGKYGVLLDEFFKKNGAYNEEMLEKHLKVSKKKANELLKWYARRELGQQILECMKDKGECFIEGEM